MAKGLPRHLMGYFAPSKQEIATYKPISRCAVAVILLQMEEVRCCGGYHDGSFRDHLAEPVHEDGQTDGKF